MSVDLGDYFSALALTVAIEYAVAFALGYRGRREFAAVALCSLVTHPALHVYLYRFYDFGEGMTSPTIVAAECVVVAIEFFILCFALPKRGRRMNAFVALSMNAASYIAGLYLV